MIITGWHVDGYGIFADYEVQGLGPGLTVAYGPNEAGKSTLLDFIRFVLFGHKVDRREPLHGGRHGGRLYISDDAGLGWIVERYATGRGRLAVTREDGGRGSEDDLFRLTGGMDASSFRSIFAFSLYELSRFETLSATGVRDRIFSSGITGAGAEASEARQKFDRQAAELLRPRSGGKINGLLDELKSVRDDLREARSRAAEYPAVLRREQDAASRVAALDEETVRLGEKIRRLTVLLELWEPYNRWDAANRRLQEMPDHRLPPELPAEMRDLRVAAEGAREQHAELVRRLEELTREREALVERPEIVALAGDIRRIAAELALHQNRLEQRVKLRSEICEGERRLHAQLLGLGEGHTAEAFPGLQLPVTTADELLGWERRLFSARREAERTAADVEGAGRKVRVLTERLERLRGEHREVLEGPGPEDVASGREHLEEMRLIAGRLDVLRVGLRGTAALGAVLGAGGLLGVLSGRAGWGSALLAGGALALVGLGLIVRFLRHRQSAFSGHAAAIGLGESGPGGNSEAEVLAEGRRRLRDAEENARRKGEVRGEIRSAEGELERAELDLRELTAAARQADAALSAAEDRWRQWKAGCGLPEQLSTDGVRDFLAVLERARDAQARLCRARDELLRIEESIEAWEQGAGRMLAEAGEEAAGDLPAQVSALSSVLDDALEAARKGRQLDARLDEARRDLQASTARLRGLEARRHEILQAAGAEDDTGFNGMVEEAEKRAACLAEVNRTWAVVEARLGRGEYADRMRGALAAGDPEAWEAELAAAREQMRDVGEQRDRAVEERRDAQRDREELEVTADVPSLAAREEAIIDEIRRSVADWRTVCLARELIDRALESYVRERQPEVLKVASQVLGRITGGRYTTVVQDTGGEGLSVLDGRGLRRSPDGLSRGTLEQLYLSMRLGLAESLAGRATSLPLVMDDVLVNFDPNRARRLVESLGAYLSDERRQIMIFTCHPETRDLVGSVVPGAAIIEVGRPVPEAGVQVAASRRAQTRRRRSAGVDGPERPK